MNTTESITIYFERAVELGNLILASETSLRLADAKAAFEADEAAQEAYAEYNEYQERLKIARESGFMTREGYQQALARLVEMEIDVKNRPAAQEYLKAQSDYDNFANSVLEMLRMTVGLDAPGHAQGAGCGGCGGRR